MRTNSVRRAALLALGLGIVAGGMAFQTTRPAVADEPAQGGDQAEIKRGAYLTNEVARCGDCHTPKNRDGSPDTNKHLQGAKTWFRPLIKPKGKWEDRAPDITASGFATKWKADKMTKFLSTGGHADAPMPAYHLTTEDARAVTAYLRSLPGKGGGPAGKKK